MIKPSRIGHDPGKCLICEKCGLNNPDEFKFCPKCGTVLEKRPKVDHSRIKPQKEALIGTIQTRASTDTIVTPAWIWIMLIFYVAGVVASVAIGFSVAFDIIVTDPTTFDQEQLFDALKDEFWIPAILDAIFYALATVLGYMLVSRLNNHFRRDQEMRRGVIDLMTAASSAAGADRTVQADVYQLSQIDGRINHMEERRNPFLWALVVATPLLVSIVQYAILMTTEDYNDYQGYSLMLSIITYLSYIPFFYLSYFLGKSIVDHHNQWTEFADQTSSVAYRLGFEEVRPDWAASLESKSYALFILVTIITAGLFMFYWWYTLVQDPNRHMKAQWSFEDSLIKSISGRA